MPLQTFAVRRLTIAVVWLAALGVATARALGGQGTPPPAPKQPTLPPVEVIVVLDADRVPDLPPSPVVRVIRTSGGVGPSLAKHAGVEAWQEAVAWSTKAARPSGWMPARRTVIEIRWFTTRAGRDADNPIKALLDGIKVGLGCDDKGFLPRVMENEKDARRPRTHVTVTND